MAENDGQNPANSDTTNAHLQSDNQPKNDPSNNLTPEHPRFKEVIAKNHEYEGQIKDLTSQMDDLKKQVAERQNKPGESQELTAEEDVALDRIAKGLTQKGYVVTPDEYKTEKRAREYDRMSERHDGKDSLPKFVSSEVEAFAQSRGMTNLEDAYQLMHHDAIVQVEAKKQGTNDVPVSDSPGGGRSTSLQNTEGKKLTPEDIANMSDEDYEKNRSAILSSMKPKASYS